jgi:DNA-binding GntR family transcriptional regulator
MTDVTHILAAIEQGDPHAAEQLLPLVYEEVRKLAAQKMAQESRVRRWKRLRSSTRLMCA